MNVLETSKDEEQFAYFDVQNLSIDHSLIMSEIDEYKDLIFSPNSLEQIYFKGDCDVETIELVKDLLSISEYVDDSRIDKYIILRLRGDEINRLLNSTYENPSTWNMPYERENDNYSLTDIPHYRAMNAFINRILNINLSTLEQVMKVYDEIKLMDFDQEEEFTSLPDLVIKRKANSYGMNRLFAYVLSTMGFKTFIGETIQNDVKSYVTLVEIKDEKYNIDGIYLFDPSMDTLSKDDYKSDSIRRINYNFFCIPLSFMSRLTYDEKLLDILSLLAIEDTDYSSEKLENSRSKSIRQSLEALLNSFRSDYETIHNRVRDSKEIDLSTIVRINDEVYSNKPEKYNEYLKENFTTRKKELFVKEVKEELEDFIEEEKNK